VKVKLRKLPLKVDGGDITPIIVVGLGYGAFLFQLLWLTLSIEKVMNNNHE